MEEVRDLDSLRLERMERMAQSVLSSSRPASGGDPPVLSPLNTLASCTKRRGSATRGALDLTSNKKQMTKKP